MKKKLKRLAPPEQATQLPPREVHHLTIVLDSQVVFNGEVDRADFEATNDWVRVDPGMSDVKPIYLGSRLVVTYFHKEKH